MKIVSKIMKIAAMYALAHIAITNVALASPMNAIDHKPLEHFAAHNPDNTATISHKDWSRVLGIMFERNEKTGEPTLDYGRLSTRARTVLESYLGQMQRIKISDYSRDEQLAYWLNLYNAGSFILVFEDIDRQAKRMNSASRNPHRKPRVALKGLISKPKGPWHQKKFSVEGQRISLTDIEHRIVQAYWPDPMVLYGLSCPALGCPALLPKPFEATILPSQLMAAARDFTANEDNVSLKGKKLKPSAIYNWHTNLLPDNAAILNHLRQVGPDRIRQKLTGISTVKGENFSWKLNGEMPPEGFNQPVGMFNRGSGANYY